MTGSRAEYELLRPLVREVQSDPTLICKLVVTGMHLSPEYGLTYKQIEADGFRIDAKIEMLLSSNTETSITKSVGLGVFGFASTYEKIKPDLVVLLGDRFEILAAAQAAMFMKVPIAHIHGGELTEGLVDDSIRHSITKMALLHFSATETYRKRIVQLGEDPRRVFNFGAIGVDNALASSLLSRKQFEKKINFNLGQINFLVTYHPVTLEETDNKKGIKALLSALDHFPSSHIIFTRANADAGGKEINLAIESYLKKIGPRAILLTSMGQENYFSAISLVDAVIGNSSSGIIEVPAFNKPTVNIGERQRGREMGASVLSCKEQTADIVKSIKVALSGNFKNRLCQGDSPYGHGGVATKIKNVLKRTHLKGALMKKFYDVSFKYE